LSSEKSLTSMEEIDAFIMNNRFSLLYFSRENCSVCHGLLPQVEAIINNYPNIQLGLIDTDDIQAVAGKFSIFTVPVILLFIEGKEMMREARIVHLDIFEEKLAKLYVNS